MSTLLNKFIVIFCNMMTFLKLSAILNNVGKFNHIILLEEPLYAIENLADAVDVEQS